MKLKKIIEKVSKEILNMSEDEFNKELEKHSDGDIAIALLREWKRNEENTNCGGLLTDEVGVKKPNPKDCLKGD